jgi:copper(I)-binding protein
MSAGRRAALLAAAALLVPQGAAAHEVRQGDITIIRPWVRATAAAGGAGGGYLVIRNTGTVPDRLIRAESTAARVMELHTMSLEQGVMRMRPVQDIPVPAGGEVRLAPGGLHVMFIDTTQRFQQGQRIPVRLVFERAGAIDVDFQVEAPGARAPGHAH